MTNRSQTQSGDKTSDLTHWNGQFEGKSSSAAALWTNWRGELIAELG